MKNGKPQLKDVPVLGVLAAIHEHRSEHFQGEPWTRRRGLDRFPPKLLYCWLETKRGTLMVEYGTSARCCWLTEEGERWLEALRSVQALYARHAAGCCLHVVLDDGNCSDASVGFCIGQAELQGHADCLALAHTLRSMSQEQRWALYSDPSKRPEFRPARRLQGNARVWKRSGRARRA